MGFCGGSSIDILLKRIYSAVRFRVAKRIVCFNKMRVKCLRLHGGLPNLNRGVRISLPAPKFIAWLNREVRCHPYKMDYAGSSPAPGTSLIRV